MYFVLSILRFSRKFLKFDFEIIKKNSVSAIFEIFGDTAGYGILQLQEMLSVSMFN